MNTLVKIVYWTPRILSILAIALILLFGADAFDPKLSLQDQLIGFMMHSIPGVILILILLVAWKWELIGGLIYILIGVGFTPFVFMMNYQRLERFQHPNPFWISVSIVATITFPFILAGALFVWSHVLRKKKTLSGIRNPDRVTEP